MAGLPATMKALVKEKAGPSYEYKDVPVPVPRGDELLVRVGKVALCGSDIALHQWNNGTRIAFTSILGCIRYILYWRG